MNIWEETMNTDEIQQWHKGLRPETGATSGNQEDIIWDLQANSQVGDHEVSSQSFHLVAESDWTLWRGRPSPKWKKRCQKHFPLKRRWWYTYTLSGNCLGWVALRREQHDHLESNHREKWASAKLIADTRDSLGTQKKGYVHCWSPLSSNSG